MWPATEKITLRSYRKGKVGKGKVEWNDMKSTWIMYWLSSSPAASLSEWEVSTLERCYDTWPWTDTTGRKTRCLLQRGKYLNWSWREDRLKGWIGSSEASGSACRHTRSTGTWQPRNRSSLFELSTSRTLLPQLNTKVNVWKIATSTPIGAWEVEILTYRTKKKRKERQLDRLIGGHDN